MKLVFRFQPLLRAGSRAGSRAVLPGLMMMVAGASSPSWALPTSSAAPLDATPEGAVIISEMRPSGPGGARDAFIELFNTSAKPLSLSGWSLRLFDEKGAPASVTLAPGTQIGARGHWLLTGRAYSLQKLAAGDVGFEARVVGGVALLDASGKIIDAVGAANAPAMAREGAGLPLLAFPATQARETIPQFSYVRRALDGQPQDTGDNAQDFALVSVTGALLGQKTQIGAPGPENSTSPRLRPQILAATFAQTNASDPLPQLQLVALQADPERNSMRRARRDTGPLKTFGTMTLRYRLSNASSQPIKNLWFRAASITCDPDATSPGNATATPAENASGNFAVADIRLLRGKAASATLAKTAVPPPTAQGDAAAQDKAPAQRTLSVWKAKLVAVPLQPLGGGLNALLQVELPAGGIAPGARGEVTFSFGVERRGNYRVVLGNEKMNLVFEGNTEDDLGEATETAAAGPGMGRNASRSSVSMSRGGILGGAQGVGAPGTVGATSGSLAAGDLPVDIADGIIIEGNTEDGVIVPPIKPSGNPT